MTETQAQKAVAPYEAAAKDAEANGDLRETLRQHVLALQALPIGNTTDSDNRIRQSVISLVAQLDPSPAIKDPAREHFDRAEVIAKQAKTEFEFGDAATEYERCLREAPWMATAYFNMGLCYERTGDYARAARALRFYLAGAVDAKECAEVKAKIAELDVALRRLSSVEGVWYEQAASGTLLPWLKIARARGGWIVTYLDPRDGSPYSTLENSTSNVECSSTGHIEYDTMLLEGPNEKQAVAHGHCAYQLSQDGLTLDGYTECDHNVCDLSTNEVVGISHNRYHSTLYRQP